MSAVLGCWFESDHPDFDDRQPGRSTVEDAVLIRRRRRFDSFSGYFNWEFKETDMLQLHRLKRIPATNTGSWCNGSTSVF